MTVKQLIKALSQYPPDFEVRSNDEGIQIWEPMKDIRKDNGFIDLLGEDERN